MAKFYAIARGFKTGIAHDEETRQILTNNYKDNSNKSFKTRPEAVEWLDKRLGAQAGGDWPDIDEEDARAARHAAEIEKAARGAESTAASQAADVYRAEERRRVIAEATLRGKRSAVAPAPGRFSQPTSSSSASLQLVRGPVSLATFRSEFLEGFNKLCDRFGLRDAPATPKLLLPAPEPSFGSNRAGTVNTLPSSPQDKQTTSNESAYKRKQLAPGSPTPSFLKPKDTRKGRSRHGHSPLQSMDSTPEKQTSSKSSFRDRGRSRKSAVSEDEDDASSDPFASDSEASEESPPRSQRSRGASYLSSKPAADASTLKSSNRRFKEASPAFSDSIIQKKRGRAESRSRTTASHSQPTPGSHRERDHSRAKRDKTTRSPPATFDQATLKKRRLDTFDGLLAPASGINTPRKPSARKASRAGSVSEMPASKKSKHSPRNVKKATSSRHRSHSDSEEYEGPISVASDTASVSDSVRSASPMRSKRKAYDSPGSSARQSESEKSDSDASDNSDISIPLKSRRSRHGKRR